MIATIYTFMDRADAWMERSLVCEYFVGIVVALFVAGIIIEKIKKRNQKPRVGLEYKVQRWSDTAVGCIIIACVGLTGGVLMMGLAAVVSRILGR